MAKIALWTLNINDYEPEITNITYPTLKNYAHKIGADFNVITERKFPEMGIFFEKMQMYEGAKEYDWNIFVDSDAIIHSDFFDFTKIMRKDTVLVSNLNHNCLGRFRNNKYFERNGRYIDVFSYMAVFSNICRDLVNPELIMTREEMESNIFGFHSDRLLGALEKINKNGFMLDEYQMALNISRFGLKAQNLENWFRSVGINFDNYWFHLSQVSTIQADKVAALKHKLQIWRLHESKIDFSVGASLNSKTEDGKDSL